MKTNVLNYRVIIEPEKYPDGSKVYNAYCPSLGITDYGDSVEEVLESIKDGILLAVDTMVKAGKDVPMDHVDEQIVASAKVSLPKGLQFAFG